MADSKYYLSYTAQQIDERLKKVDDIPTKNSQLENDSGYITKDTAEKTYQPIGDYVTQEDLPSVPTKTSELTNDSGFITLEEVPKVDLSDYAKSEEVANTYQTKGNYATIEELNKKQDTLTAGGGIDIKDNVISCTLDTTLYKVVTELPDVGEEHKIYLMESADVGEQNIYTEYGYINGEWEKLGEYRATIDLSDYLTKKNAEETYVKKDEVPEEIYHMSEFTKTSGYITESLFNEIYAAIESDKLIMYGNLVCYGKNAVSYNIEFEETFNKYIYLWAVSFTQVDGYYGIWTTEIQIGSQYISSSGIPYTVKTYGRSFNNEGDGTKFLNDKGEYAAITIPEEIININIDEYTSDIYTKLSNAIASVDKNALAHIYSYDTDYGISTLETQDYIISSKINDGYLYTYTFIYDGSSITLSNTTKIKLKSDGDGSTFLNDKGEYSNPNYDGEIIVDSSNTTSLKLKASSNLYTGHISAMLTNIFTSEDELVKILSLDKGKYKVISAEESNKFIGEILISDNSSSDTEGITISGNMFDRNYAFGIGFSQMYLASEESYYTTNGDIIVYDLRKNTNIKDFVEGHPALYNFSINLQIASNGTYYISEVNDDTTIGIAKAFEEGGVNFGKYGNYDIRRLTESSFPQCVYVSSGVLKNYSTSAATQALFIKGASNISEVASPEAILNATEQQGLIGGSTSNSIPTKTPIKTFYIINNSDDESDYIPLYLNGTTMSYSRPIIYASDVKNAVIYTPNNVVEYISVKVKAQSVCKVTAVLMYGNGSEAIKLLIDNDYTQSDKYTLNFTMSDGTNTGTFDEDTYNSLKTAIEDGKCIIVKGNGGVKPVSATIGTDLIVLRWNIATTSDDNTVTLSVYELTLTSTTYTSKAIHKVIS